MPLRSRCAQCGKTYGRVEHLTRHIRTHTSSLPYNCDYCGKRYARGDVLKRHYASCREASKQSKIETSGSAEVQKRDYLVETPAKGNSTASFAPTPPTALLADQPWSTPTSHHAFCLESSFHDSFILSMEPTISFNFLNRFTSGLELRKAFAALDKVADEQLLLPDCTAASRCLCTTLPTIVCQPCRFCTFVGRYSLEQTANQIINDLSSGGSPDGRLIALKAFFSASHLRKGLRLYWSDWHPNLPIIHPCRSPFESAPAPLVAAMAVIGICHSPDPQERADAKLYYDMLERYVFAHLASFRGRQIAGRTLRDLVQALQAAYLVLIYQSWDGERAARLNVRRTRFAQMVEVIHTIGVSRAVHPDYRRIDFADFDFQAYVETEELVRLLTWCFLVDTAFTIFFNIAPRFVLRELRMGLSSPESCFNATTPDECLAQLQKWQYQSMTRSTLYDLIKATLSPAIDIETQIRMAYQSTITMFSIVSALHVMLFNSDPTIGHVAQYTPIYHGLGNWQTIWNRQRLYCPLQSIDTNLAGFWQYCSDYWLLAKLFTEQITQAAATCHAPGPSASPCYDEESQMKLHIFIRQYESATRASLRDVA